MKGLLRFKAILMVILIVMIPFYISYVFADDSLDVIRYGGEDNINGYFKNYDKWVFEAIVNLDGDSSISTNQVRFQDVDAQNCDSVNGGFKCSYESDYYTIPDGSYPVTVKLLDDGGAEVLTEDVEMTVDRLEPTIDFESIGQKGLNVSVLFTVKDRAYIEDDFTKCSGIDKIEFYDGVNLLETTIVNSSQCRYSGSEDLTGISSDRVIIKAYDRLGYMASEASPEIEFDFNAPVINPATFRILKNGADMGNYLSSMPDVADFSVEITEDKGLKAENIYADFSSLAGSAKVSANSCSREEEVFTCIWNNVPVGTTSISVPVVANDNVGNSASATLSKTVSVDSSGPLILFIGTDRIYGESSFISTTADILVKISESGSGVDSGNVRLDLGGLNPAYGIEAADECIQSGETYNCYWYNRSTTLSHNSKATLYLITLSDNAGNPATGPTQGTVIVDKQAPDIGDVRLEAVSELGVAKILKSNDDLTVFASAADPNGLSARGDFSNIRGSGYEDLDAICESAAGEFTCRWDIPTVFSGYLNTSAALNFIDTAGNAASVNIPIVIYGVEDEENPNYWTYGPIDRMPDALDRQTTALINQNTYFHIPLISEQGAIPLNIDLGECTGENIDFIESTDIMNNQLGSTDPYVILTLKTTDAKVDAVKANCSLRITSLYNNRVSNVEYETIPLTIEFYNQPLGEASQSLDKKINDLKDEWLGSTFWDAIGFLQGLNDIATIFCQGYYIFRTVISVFQAVTTAWGNIEFWTALSPVGPGVRAARVSLCLGTEETRAALNTQAENFFEKLCDFANCKLGPLPQGQEIKGLEYWGTVLGGGGGLADVFSQVEVPGLGARWYEKYTGREAFGASGFMNVKDSLVLSTLTVCIPGIVYNLEKMRQINCMYIDCLESVGDTGISADACDKSKSYLECKFIWGEVFQFFPVFQIFDYYMDLIKNALSNPFSIAGAVVSAVGCRSLCIVDEPTHSACIWVKIIADIGDAIANSIGIAQIIENDWKLREDYCENIEYGSNQSSGGGSSEGGLGGIFG